MNKGGVSIPPLFFHPFLIIWFVRQIVLYLQSSLI
nr:MAG TPA: hypothetical protein [Caudoviricetes sp.]